MQAMGPADPRLLLGFPFAEEKRSRSALRCGRLTREAGLAAECVLGSLLSQQAEGSGVLSTSELTGCPLLQ